MITKEVELRSALLGDNNIIAFIGSGISSNYLSWKDFIVELCKYSDYKEGNDLVALMDPNSIDTETLLLIAGEAKKKITESELRDFMAKLFSPEKTIPTIFRAIINSPFRFYITTNYDTNIEDTYLNINGSPLNVVFPSQVDDVFKYIKQGTPFVLKVHGCVKQGRDFVISLDDYLKKIYLNRDLGYVLSSIFSLHQIVFLGYGHRDPHICRYLEYEKMILPYGGMRRYSFVKDGDFPVTLRARLQTLGVSYVMVPKWSDVEIFLNQLVISRAALGTESSKTKYRQDFLSFIREPKIETVTGALMFLFTGSEIKDGDQVIRINKIIDDNKSIQTYIEITPSLNLLFRILKAQTFKRSQETEKAKTEYEEIVRIADTHTDLLTTLRSIAYKYAGMFWVYPSGLNSSPVVGLSTARDLAYSESLFEKAYAVLGPELVRERLDIQKWKAIVRGETGNRMDAAKELVNLGEQNERYGYKKDAAWSRYASVSQMVEGDLVDLANEKETLNILDKAYWGFAELDHIFGVGSVFLLKAKVLRRLHKDLPEWEYEINDCTEQARARAVVTRDMRLLYECDYFREGKLY